MRCKIIYRCFIFCIIQLLTCKSPLLAQQVIDTPIAQLGKGNLAQILFSPDGKKIVLAGSLGLWFYDANNLQELELLKGHTGSVNWIAFSPDGNLIASGIGNIELWDVKTKHMIAELKGHTSYVLAVKFSPDGRILASGDYNKDIILWDIESRQQLVIFKRAHEGPIRSFAFSPDKRWLASAADDK